MENKALYANPPQPKQETQLSFDQFVKQISAAKQSAHRWVAWLTAVALILAVDVFIYAIYTSITWKSSVGANVILAWIYSFIAGSFAAFLIGLDTLILGATLPWPFEASKLSYTTGPQAIKEGRNLVVYGLIVIITAIGCMVLVRAGVVGIENLVKCDIGIMVAIGIFIGVQAVLRRILHVLGV